MGELNFTTPPGTQATFRIKDEKRRDLWRMYKNGTLVSTCNYRGQIIGNAGDKYKYLTVGLWDFAASQDTLKYPLMRLPFAVTIQSIHIAVDTTIVANATNYETYAVKDADGNTICSITTASTGFTLGVPRSMGTISSTYGALIANEGIYLQTTVAAAGHVSSGVVVIIKYTIDNQYSNSVALDETIPPVFSYVDSPDAAEVILSDRLAGDHLDWNDGALIVDVDGKVITTSVDKYRVFVANLGAITVSGPTPGGPFGIFKPASNIKIHQIYVGDNTALALSSDDNYLTITFNKFVSATSYKICDCSTMGPYSSGQALTAGQLDKIGDLALGTINNRYNELTSSDQLNIAVAKTGTGGTNLVGLTVQILYEVMQ